MRSGRSSTVSVKYPQESKRKESNMALFGILFVTHIVAPVAFCVVDELVNYRKGD